VIKLDFKATKAGFFDRKAVINAVDKATRKVLSRFGAFVRTRSRSSIRKRKKVSAPGSPPSSHAGLLKKFLFFAYDDSRKSVVVGPVRIGGTVDPDALPALEHGGESVIEERKGGKRKRISIKARPFMGPALAKELPGLPAMWKNSVR
jgi:hypothetical protein